MMRRVGHFWRHEEGAVAPTLALSLFGLIAVSGIAFDYARMASLDTELQNAADQAALAAAGQLDQGTDSRQRATAAAQDLVENITVFANDGGGIDLDVPTVEFYSTYNAGRADLEDAPGTTSTSDADAFYVRVTVDTREANFALTPIVAAFSSGQLTARALAGLGSATCNLPPVMICNPYEQSSPGTDLRNLVGYGVQLVNQGGSGGWAPGNFAYLDDPATDNGTPGVRASLGWDSIPGGCAAGPGVDTETGLASTVTDAINTRFDILSTQGCPVGGTCSASTNAVKDLVRPIGAGVTGNGCRIHSNGWQLPANYYGDDDSPADLRTLTDAEADGLDSMGHPRDICHLIENSAGGCADDQVGDGAWDRNAYFRVNHPAIADTWETVLTNAGYDPATLTRYEVYLWELDGNMPEPDPRPVGTNEAQSAPICGPSMAPGGSNPDRRKISAALVNCVAAGVAGSAPNVRPYGWIDLFIVEPSLNRDRTNAGEIYVEVIGPGDNDGEGIGEVVARNVPRLLE